MCTIEDKVKEIFDKKLAIETKKVVVYFDHIHYQYNIAVFTTMQEVYVEHLEQIKKALKAKKVWAMTYRNKEFDACCIMYCIVAYKRDIETLEVRGDE